MMSYRLQYLFYFGHIFYYSDDCPVLMFGFPEKYLQDAWPIVKQALKEYGISCELNLVSNFFFFLREYLSVSIFSFHGTIIHIPISFSIMLHFSQFCWLCDLQDAWDFIIYELFLSFMNAPSTKWV